MKEDQRLRAFVVAMVCGACALGTVGGAFFVQEGGWRTILAIVAILVLSTIATVIRML